MLPSALTGHPELTVHAGSAPGSFTFVVTRTGAQQLGCSPRASGRPGPGRAGAKAWPALAARALRLAWLTLRPAERGPQPAARLVPPALGLGVPVRGGEGQEEPEEEPAAQSAGRGEAVRGRVLPLRRRRPAGAVRPQVLHQGLPPGLPGPGQAALRWVPPQPRPLESLGAGGAGPLPGTLYPVAARVHVAGGGREAPWARERGQSEASGPVVAWSPALCRLHAAAGASPTGPGEEAGRWRAGPQGDRGPQRGNR